MSDALIVGIISALVSILSIVVTSKTTRDKITAELRTQNEVQNVRLENLTDEVKKHNNFAMRVPVLEEQIKVINHRIDDLERKS